MDLWIFIILVVFISSFSLSVVAVFMPFFRSILTNPLGLIVAFVVAVFFWTAVLTTWIEVGG